MKNKILLLSSLVATTYSADFGRSASPFSYNLVNSKYFAITAGLSNNSNFLSLIQKDKFPTFGANPKKVDNKMKEFNLEQVKTIKGQLATPFATDTVLTLNVISLLQTFVDINVILRPSEYFHLSWQLMTIVKHGLIYGNLNEEVNKDEKKVDNTMKMTFWASFILPTITLNIPYVAFHFSTSQLLLYSTQIEYGDKTMKFYSGMLLSGIRICPKFSNNPTTNVIAAKVLDIGFAAVALYCLKDFSFKYWVKKEENKDQNQK